MKEKLYYLLFFIFLMSFDSYGKYPSDSTLLKSTKELETEVKNQKAIIKELQIKEEYSVQRTGSVISTVGNQLNFLSVLIGLTTLFFLGMGYYTIRWTASAKERAAKELESIAGTKNEIDNVKNEIDPLAKQFKDAKIAIDLIATESRKMVIDQQKYMVDSQKKWEIERQILFDYTIACEKLEAGAILQAQNIFDGILEKNPTHFRASCKIAMCLSSMGKDDIALGKVSELLALYSNEPHIHSTKGVILRRLKRYSHAIESFQKIIDMDAYKRSTYTHIGYCYLYDKKYEKANEYFERAKIDKSSPAYYGLVKVHVMSNADPVPEKLLKNAKSMSLHDLMEAPQYPYYNFGVAFLDMCDKLHEDNKSGEGKRFEDSIDKAMGCCRNLGILKEQLFEYQLIAERGVTPPLVNFAINKFSKHIKDIESKVESYYEVLSING
ncbi:MAG: hypothetical protein JWP45_662 [Mucilaginibacter sp.]|nr:hypothetical protein [Mucilaginibacter sp.]